jgi:hypothetical protein
MGELREELIELDVRIAGYDRKIRELYRNSEICQRLGKVEGIGPVTATALVAAHIRPDMTAICAFLPSPPHRRMTRSTSATVRDYGNCTFSCNRSANGFSPQVRERFDAEAHVGF